MLSSTFCDEFGLDRVKRSKHPPVGSSPLQDHRRAETRSAQPPWVTNVDFDKWGDYLFDGPLAMALLDRLVQGRHHPQDQRQVLSCARPQGWREANLTDPSAFPSALRLGRVRGVTTRLAPFQPPNWPRFSPPPTPLQTRAMREYAVRRGWSIGELSVGLRRSVGLGGESEAVALGHPIMPVGDGVGS